MSGAGEMGTRIGAGAMPAGRVGMVCFDLGGVIVRHCRSWAEGCAAAGVRPKPGHDDPASIAGRRELSGLHTRGKMGCEEYYESMSRLVAHPPSEVRRIHHAWLQEEYPGIGAVIGSLRRAGGARTGILSNTNQAHWIRLEGQDGAYTTPALLEHRHASHLLGFGKPEMEIYEAFERRTGFAGSEILFFDDLEENIRAAAARGWQAVLIDHRGDTAGQVAGHLAGRGLLI